ncbi:hypothetical protein SRB5_45320 [Streptomyces sp. RB5]|uniref:HTH marR-type domain-containing protein n=1 Tax=Streptomyces smaragdinus TaxID=2585196 RepID=A0A7K0CLK6_9ACTN|nr:MarR family winged helix-turn-helix transcriptional regulator [Streptomyces smaragdinus]MQY14366.1 hypothetical protein [Streptomyces smaragdinus]
MSYVTPLFLDLVRVETRLYNALSTHLRTEHGVTLGQFEFLEIIDRVADCRVLDIAREVAITVGAVSKAVDRLVTAGWCVRVAHPQDRRSSVLRLTPAGESVLASSRPTLEKELAALTTPIPAADLKRLATTLATLRTALEAADRGQPG